MRRPTRKNVKNKLAIMGEPEAVRGILRETLNFSHLERARNKGSLISVVWSGRGA